MKNLNVFFSPKGTTRKVSCKIAEGILSEFSTIDLLKTPLTDDLSVEKSGCVILSLPVYVGRMPTIVAQQLKHLKGDGTPAIIIAVYGNRAYEDALVEMQDIMTANGFIVVAGAAFVAEHSIFTQVAQGRPNLEDEAVMTKFAIGCKAVLENGGEMASKTLNILGNRPYRDIAKIPLTPSGDKNCNGCGTCKALCPTNAVMDDPRKTDKSKCLSCGACIKACPQKSRNYRGLLYKVAGGQFAKKCSVAKQPELFFAK